MPKEEDAGWLHNPNQHGCAILTIDQDGVHTEAKAIDFLITSRAITSSAKLLDEEAYIGISKKCCKDCNLMVNAANDVLREQYSLVQNYLRVSGAHNRSFKDYKKPYFLQRPKTRRQRQTASSSIASSGRDQTLSQNIREKLEMLQKQQEQVGYTVSTNMSPNTDSARSGSPSDIASGLDFSSISPLANTPPEVQSNPPGSHPLTFGESSLFFSSTNSALSSSSNTLRNQDKTIREHRRNLANLHAFIDQKQGTMDITTLEVILRQINEIGNLIGDILQNRTPPTPPSSGPKS